MAKLPKYDKLPIIEKTGERHAWGVWGKDDQIGMVNLLTAGRVKHAASLVKKGKIINIEPSRGIPEYTSPTKVQYELHITRSRTGRSDYVDHWSLHGGWGHLDGLGHFRYREFGYYGGRQDEDLDNKGMNGIEKWAQHGIVGRGVLIDVAHHFEKLGQPLDPGKRFYIGHRLIETIAKEEKITFQPGDIILLRTGWRKWYLSLTPEEKGAFDTSVPGHEERDIDFAVLDRFQSTAAWLWDHQAVAIWADNGAVESHTLGDPALEGKGSNHQRLIALMGIGIGEFFDFEELSQDCAQDGVYECMVTAKPVNIPGATASQANAYAIK